LDEKNVSKAINQQSYGGFQGWMADYTRIMGIEDFRGIERIVRNSTIKVGIFS
jgi:hypothetical protein